MTIKNALVFFWPDFFGMALAAVLVASGIGFLLARNVAHLPHAQLNARSLHTRPIPRVAALMSWGGILAGLLVRCFWPEREAHTAANSVPLTFWVGLFLGWAAIAGISLRDDWGGVPARRRLLVHVISGAVLVVSVYSLLPAGAAWDSVATPNVIGIVVLGLSMGLGVLAVAWMGNLFNFMDGSDGLAVAMALAGFATYGTATYAENIVWWWVPALVAVAALPLFYVNFPPARMFIGDVGAVPLGYLAAGLGGLGWAQGVWGAWLPLLAFLPFILDASITLLQRLARGERVWEGHKSHYYQRLLQMGAGHRGTLAVYGALMVGCAATAVICQCTYPVAGWWALALWTAVHLWLFATIDYHWRKQRLT